jgi:hypothetical protein
MGTTMRPNSALIVVVGDSVNAAATVAMITIAAAAVIRRVAVMIARISSSTWIDLRLSDRLFLCLSTLRVTLVTGFEEIVAARPHPVAASCRPP